MKRFLLLALFALVVVQPTSTYAEELNGWAFVGSSGPIDTSFTRLVADTATEGMYSQAFGWHGEPMTWVEWEKYFPAQETPWNFFIQARLNVLEPVDSSTMDASVFVIFFGDSSTLHETQGGELWHGEMDAWFNFYFASDYIPDPPPSFVRIRIRMFSGPNPTSTEWFFDNLQLWYQDGSRVVLDGFGDAPPVLSVGDAGGLPTKTVLSQNYPNPFNPTTNIAYSLPNASDVMISIFSMLGERVAILVDERQEAGEHSVAFDGRMLPSGTYFYRLETEGFVETRKMVLLK